MKKWVYIVAICCSYCWTAQAAEMVMATDSISSTPNFYDSLQVAAQDTLPPQRVVSKYKPNADKSIWLSAVVPGLGQIYNRQYWKLPIIYGGAMGLAYAISWNNQMYVDYRKAYVDIVDQNPDSKSYEYVLPPGTVVDDSNRDYFTRVIKNKQDNYQRNRDLSIICTFVLYILTMVDAYVDAQMYDYDIGPNLSLQVSPAVLPPSMNHETDSSVGLRCKMKF